MNDEIKASTIKTLVTQAIVIFSQDQVAKLIDNLKEIVGGVLHIFKEKKRARKAKPKKEA